MALVASCGSCGKQFQAEAHLAGKTVACPVCRGVLTVPRQNRTVPATAPRPHSTPAHKPTAPATPQIIACVCGARFQAAAHLAGRTVRCPTCQQPLQIPRQARRARQQPVVSPPPADGFWDDLAPRKRAEPATAAVAQTRPAQQAFTGPQATAFAIEQLSRGRSPAAVRGMLLERQVPPGEANRIVETLQSGSRSRSTSSDRDGSSGLGNMLIGGAICFIGIAVTAGSYLAAEPGGMFLLAWGPIIFGGIQFFRGMGQMVFD